ncbi:MAG: hypothetical protein M0030_32205 [Actinomycetota bacterium]|nr:hypothetical protein [Actinomycetota bacterium]
MDATPAGRQPCRETRYGLDLTRRRASGPAPAGPATASSVSTSSQERNGGPGPA